VDLKPTAEQQQLIDAFADLYADLSTPDQVRAAEPLGHDAALWRRLLDTGVVAMAVPEARGGHGASLLDLALVAEQHGRAAAPAPVIETQVAARLLSRIDAPSDVVDAVVHGQRTVTLAVRPAVGGRAELVPAGAVADDALVLVDGTLVLVPLTGRATPVANLGCLPLADVADLSGETLVSGPAAATEFATAIDEWRVLTAAALAGIAAAALEVGIDYVKQRKAFDRPLAAFQAIGHRLADRATEVDGAQLLAREAAWASEADRDRLGELAAMALGFAAETARDTTYHALHFHGGYGFMLEYPVQLYYRRARSWAAVLESPAQSYQRVADLHREPGAA
jgi:alkylation response protein AidB-like acyl-CoA dehydrogenase